MTDRYIAVTGANGYIGEQFVLYLKSFGYKVLCVGRPNPNQWLRNIADVYIPADITSPLFMHAMATANPEGLIHLASTSGVSNSVSNPGIYYANNVGSTAKMLGLLAERNWKKPIVFASSASVYGCPGIDSIVEETPLTPTSPYGHSKLIIEQMLPAFSKAHGFKTISLRLFNVAGADSLGRTGPRPGNKSLIPSIMESILNKQVLNINGNDYPTYDGTCIRDYIHVEDVASALLTALRQIQSSDQSNLVFNLGTGKGHSAKDIVSLVEQHTSKVVLNTSSVSKDFEPPVLVSSTNKFKRATGWKAEKTINDIISDSWSWYNSAEFRKRV